MTNSPQQLASIQHFLASQPMPPNMVLAGPPVYSSHSSNAGIESASSPQQQQHVIASPSHKPQQDSMDGGQAQGDFLTGTPPSGAIHNGGGIGQTLLASPSISSVGQTSSEEAGHRVRGHLVSPSAGSDYVQLQLPDGLRHESIDASSMTQSPPPHHYATSPSNPSNPYSSYSHVMRSGEWNLDEQQSERDGHLSGTSSDSLPELSAVDVIIHVEPSPAALASSSIPFADDARLDSESAHSAKEIRAHAQEADMEYVPPSRDPHASEDIAEGDESAYGEEEAEEGEDEFYTDEEGEDDYDEAEEEGEMLPSGPALLSSEESLAELELVKMNRFSLIFENQKMEQIFEKHFTGKLSENFLLLNLLVVGQHTFLGIVEYVTGTTRHIELPIFLCRIIIVFIFLTSAFFTWTGKKRDEDRVKEMERRQREEENREMEQPNHPNQSTALITTAGGAGPRGGEVSSGLTFEEAFALDVHKRGNEVEIDLEDRRRRHDSQQEYSESRMSSSNRSDGSSADTGAKLTGSGGEAPPTRLYLLKLIVLLNFLQGATMLIAFTLASRIDVDDTHREFTLYSPTAGELSTAFSLVLYGFIFIGSGMLLRYAVPLGFAYFISSLIISASLHSPSGIFASSIVLQLIFLVLCTWNMHSMERQVRKELILLCTVARDRARGNDLINNMLPPSMVLRLQLMQQESAENAAKMEQQAGEYAFQEVEVQDENGQIVVKRVPVVQPEPLHSSSPLNSLDSGALLHASTHFYDCYENVSILFCYISSFSQLVCYMEPQSLVKLLNDVFSAFDDSILTFDGMYKVEAIAETYMAVSGCPFVNARHAQTVAEFALNMQEIIARNQDAYEATLDAQIYHMITAQSHDGKQQQPPKFVRGTSTSLRGNGGGPPQLNRGRSSLRLQSSLSSLGVDGKLAVPSVPQRPSQLSIQIGIHSGPIAAGVIGTKTLSYHIFGDAVNTASRMCSTSSPDNIQCSSATSSLLGDEFTPRFSRDQNRSKGKVRWRHFLSNRALHHREGNIGRGRSARNIRL